MFASGDTLVDPIECIVIHKERESGAWQHGLESKWEIVRHVDYKLCILLVYGLVKVILAIKLYSSS